MSSPKSYQPLDANGKRLRVGDRVLVTAAPISVVGMETATKSAFSRAIGHTLQIRGFAPDGCVELEMLPPRFKGLDTIWLEPFLVKRVAWSPLPRPRRTSNQSLQKRTRRKRRAAELRR